jgi:1,4-dihydroxy-2-naphthoate octaprenyltransferase
MSSGKAENWIVRTGQRPKAIVTLAIACFAPAAAVFAFSIGSFYLAIGLLVVAVLSVVAFATTVRCPKCRKSISWMVLSTRPSQRWLSDLFALEECPACDDRGEAT